MLLDSHIRYPIIKGVGSTNWNVHVLKYYVGLIHYQRYQRHCGIENRRFNNKKETDSQIQRTN